MVAELDSVNCFVAIELENGSRYTLSYKGYWVAALALFATTSVVAAGVFAAYSFSYPKGMIACKSNDEASVKSGF
jgi:hypothetical protein